jgi:hypothetical protein
MKYAMPHQMGQLEVTAARSKGCHFLPFFML